MQALAASQQAGTQGLATQKPCSCDGVEWRLIRRAEAPPEREKERQRWRERERYGEQLCSLPGAGGIEREASESCRQTCVVWAAPWICRRKSSEQPLIMQLF